MGIEAIIFFFSAFEPIHEEVDWTLVYPELAGMSDEEELRKYRSDSKHGGGGSGGGGIGMDAEAIKEIVNKRHCSYWWSTCNQSTSRSIYTASTTSSCWCSWSISFLPRSLTKCSRSAEIGPELFDRVSRGLNKLSDTSTKLADISNAAVATNDYAEKMKKASESVGSFTIAILNLVRFSTNQLIFFLKTTKKQQGIVSESGQTFMNGVSNSVNNLQDQLTKAGRNCKCTN